MSNQEKLRALPAIEKLLLRDQVKFWIEEFGREQTVEALRKAVACSREAILSGKMLSDIEEYVLQETHHRLQGLFQTNLRHVINGTGVVLHTNLGRAILSEKAVQAVTEVASGYSNLELELNTGKRGSRYSHVEELLCYLTGAEAALVVNNNAAAVLLALAAIAQDKEVIVARGQLVEIGGAFRIPEVMEQSGCALKEVGSTNKVHLHDYEKAINEQTALLLKVHTSNYRIVGFTKEVSLSQLVQLGEKANLPVMEDLGSGFLVDLQKRGIGDEPTVQESVKAGAHIVTFSGDKLLGGPQAGIIVGKKQYIDIMKRHPLNRALRVDKFTVAALEATLLAYLKEDDAIESIPTLKMLNLPKQVIKDRSEALKNKLDRFLEGLCECTVENGFSQVGGGAMPLTELPTWLLRLRPTMVRVEAWSQALRKGRPAILGRVQDESLYIDLRTVLPREEETLVLKLESSLKELRGEV